MLPYTKLRYKNKLIIKIHGKEIFQITKDTLLQDSVQLLTFKYGRERVFRTMRISHRIEIKNNKVDFDTLLQFKDFNKYFKY